MKSAIKGFRSVVLKSAIVVASCMLMVYVLAWLIPFNIKIPYAVTVTDSRGEVLHAFLSKDEKWRMKANLNEINPQKTQSTSSKSILFKAFYIVKILIKSL